MYDGEYGEVYHNVRRSSLHMFASHSIVFPCGDTIKWIIKCIDVIYMTLRDIPSEGMMIFTYPHILDYCKLPRDEVALRENEYGIFFLSSKGIQKSQW